MMRRVIDLFLRVFNKPKPAAAPSDPAKPYYQCIYLLRPVERTPFVIQLVTVHDCQNRRRHHYVVYLN